MNLRETAERIIEGVPKSYRDGDESKGYERTVEWLMDLLREFAAQRLATFINATARKSEHDDIEGAIKDWVDRGEADTKHLAGELAASLARETKLKMELLERGEVDTNWIQKAAEEIVRVEENPLIDDAPHTNRIRSIIRKYYAAMKE